MLPRYLHTKTGRRASQPPGIRGTIGRTLAPPQRTKVTDQGKTTLQPRSGKVVEARQAERPTATYMGDSCSSSSEYSGREQGGYSARREQGGYSARRVVERESRLVQRQDGRGERTPWDQRKMRDASRRSRTVQESIGGQMRVAETAIDVRMAQASRRASQERQETAIRSDERQQVGKKGVRQEASRRSGARGNGLGGLQGATGRNPGIEASRRNGEVGSAEGRRSKLMPATTRRSEVGAYQDTQERPGGLSRSVAMSRLDVIDSESDSESETQYYAEITKPSRRSHQDPDPRGRERYAPGGVTAVYKEHHFA